MILKYLRLVKFSHTIFALPFALVGYVLGSVEVGFDWLVLFEVLVCMVMARSAAMGFNRLVDWRFDARNARTAMREIPAGVISPRRAAIFVVFCSVVFVAVSFAINMLCGVLSPVALVVVLGYSYTKRFTALCHFVLGLGLAIAPAAAYIATTGHLSTTPLWLSVLVWSWVAGFDIIFSLQDMEFDRSESLHSVPARMGVASGLWISALLHLFTALSVVTFGLMVVSNYLYWIGALLFVLLLTYQHLIVTPRNLSRVGLAFGTTNGVASIIFAMFTSLALILAPTL
ncbi:MAG: UbiA-like polyprenyltransferase [Mucinivorans sp.]